MVIYNLQASKFKLISVVLSKAKTRDCKIFYTIRAAPI